MSIGEQINDVRKSQGKTLQVVADAVGSTPVQIWRLEHGNGSMPLLAKVTEFLAIEWVHLPTAPTFPDRVKQARLNRGWTQECLAMRAGVSRPAVASVERGTAHLKSLEMVLAVLAKDMRPRFVAKRKFSPGEGSDVRFTSPEFMEKVYGVLGTIDLDPTAHPDAFVKAARYYYQADNSLLKTWSATSVFCNPPFSSANTFIRRAHAAYVDQECPLIMMLVPARWGTTSWHSSTKDASVFLLEGRMNFWTKDGPMPFFAPFDNAIILWGGDEAIIARVKAFWSSIHIPPRSGERN